MNGKSKCKLLKQIRSQVARENDIAYVTSECKFQGECVGTCPKCEAELRYLEEELSKRRKMGKAVAVAGIAAALLVSAPGCTDDLLPPPISGDIPFSFTEPTEPSVDTAPEFDDGTELMGEPTEFVELMGDIAY